MRSVPHESAWDFRRAASAYRSVEQLGHSVAVAEKHYVDVARGIPRDARTLEAAMQIEEQMKRVIDAFGSRWSLTYWLALSELDEYSDIGKLKQ